VRGKGGTSSRIAAADTRLLAKTVIVVLDLQAPEPLRSTSYNKEIQRESSNLSAQHRPHATGTDLRPALVTSTDFHATRAPRDLAFMAVGPGHGCNDQGSPEP